MRARTATGALVGVLAALAPAATAGAQESVPTPTIKIAVEKVVGTSNPLTLTGERFRIRVRVFPYRPHQTVTVRVQQGASKLRVKAMSVYRPAGHQYGEALLGFTPRHTGTLLIRASHLATPELDTARARDRHVTVVTPHASAGQKGPAVRLLQRLLAAKGYVVGERGVYDARTARAVLAFRKVAGMPRTEQASESVFRKALAGGGEFKVRYPKDGHHVEGDLTHQVMALIDHGKPQRIYPISSGKPSTPTVLGRFHVYYKTPGTNAKGMVYSSYFIGGYAVHGYVDVPVYPASHGCLRTPVPDAIPIYDWIKMGDPVDVYYRDESKAPDTTYNPDPGP